jgi:hypothetical protein
MCTELSYSGTVSDFVTLTCTLGLFHLVSLVLETHVRRVTEFGYRIRLSILNISSVTQNLESECSLSHVFQILYLGRVIFVVNNFKKNPLPHVPHVCHKCGCVYMC